MKLSDADKVGTLIRRRKKALTIFNEIQAPLPTLRLQHRANRHGSWMDIEVGQMSLVDIVARWCQSEVSYCGDELVKLGVDPNN